jgi:hypothetical protein
MIWGEVVNSVRSLHLGLIHEFSLDPKLFLKDVELKNGVHLHFPEALDDFDEWDELIPPPSLEDVLPIHPVERVILEGPLLPIQKVNFNSQAELELLFQSIFILEKEWLKAVGTLNPNIEKFMERGCAVQALKLSTRLGFRKLGTV